MYFNHNLIGKWAAVFCLFVTHFLSHANTDSLDFERVILDLKIETQSVFQKYEREIEFLERDLTLVNRKLLNISEAEFDQKESFQILFSKMKLQEKLRAKETAVKFKLNKARYRKGLDLIKIMYEKILGLEHHFHSLQSYQNIMQMSNPNSYPEFQKNREVIQKKLKKNNRIQLPALWQSNPYLSATFSLVGSILGNSEPQQKEKDLNQIACILDFTVRMNSDLNLIFYETEFLKESNADLREECSRLFKEYCKIIGYETSLDDCRKEDNWETVFEKLDTYVESLETAALKSVEDPGAQKQLTKGIANLEFSIHRLLDFLDQYSLFISQGEHYYQKFEVIVSNYENEDKCSSQLPHQFDILKKDIKVSIEKFDEAYNVAELKGSKLKDLLFGEGD